MKWRTLGILAALAAAGVAAALWLGRAQPIVVDTVEVGRGPVAETVTNTRGVRWRPAAEPSSRRPQVARSRACW